MSEFPSPIGVPYISIKKDELIEAILKAVSVPYWGLYISISNEKPNCSSLEFPSPTGVLYISIVLVA